MMKTTNKNFNNRNVRANQIRGMLTTINFKISVFASTVYKM
jgi:hypothetical protein